MTAWIFLACVLGSIVGTALAVFLAIVILLWLHTPVLKRQPEEWSEEPRIHF